MQSSKLILGSRPEFTTKGFNQMCPVIPKMRRQMHKQKINDIQINELTDILNIIHSNSIIIFALVTLDYIFRKNI